MLSPSRPSLSLLLVAALLPACSRHAPEQYLTDSSDRGSVVEQVSATGDVEAIVTVNVGSQDSGNITKLYVDFNSKVQKGQVLADIDPRIYKAALERATAGLAAAKANVKKAQAALDDARRQEKRARDLIAQSLDSQADVDTAMSNREQAEANLASVKAAVLQSRADRDTAKANLVFTHITSPIDGIVISRAVDVGVTVAASFQSPTLFTIANDLTKMQILANVDEADVGKIKPGLPAKFTVDAWPGEQFTGRIREVRQAATTINNVVTYPAVIDAPNPDGKLRPGMTAAVTVVSQRRDDVVRVPNAALRFRPPADSASGSEPKGGDRSTSAQARENGPRPVGERGHRHREGADGGSALTTDATASESGSEPSAPEAPKPPGRAGHVYKLVDGKPVLLALRLGLQDPQHTEVLDGLAEGESVITGSNSPSGPSAPGSNSLLGGQRPGGGGGRRGP